MNATVFLAATYPDLARAERNANGAWTVERLLHGKDIRCLAADPHNPDVVWAGTQGSGLMRSGDRGRTWELTGLTTQTVKSVAVSPSQPGFMIAGTKPPLVYASHDGGASWEELAAFRKIPSRPFWRSPAEPPGTAYVQGLAISPTDATLLIAGIELGAVIRSTDGGQTWPGHRKGSLRDCHMLIFHATDGRYVYEGGGSGNGTAISRDAGETWEQPRAGLDRHYGWAVAADPGDPETWYVSTSPGPMKAHSSKGVAEAGLYRMRGKGDWQRLSGGLPQPLPFMPYALLTDKNAPGHLYAGMHNGDIWFTADTGDSWEQLPVSLGGNDRAMAMLSDG